MYKGLEKVDAVPPEKHNDIQFPGMGTTFRVLLDVEGKVKSVDLMSKDQIKNCWSLGNGNKNQFPAMKLTFPLLPQAHESYKSWKEEHSKPRQKDLLDFLTIQFQKYTLDLSGLTEWPDYRSRISERMKKFEPGFFHESFYQLFDRFLKIPKNGVQLLEELFLTIQKNLKEKSSEELLEIANLLFGNELDAKGNIKDGKRPTLLIDTFPKIDVDHYASSIKEVPKLSAALFELENQSSNNKKVICSLTSKQAQPVDNKFPSEKLSIVGNTIIFSKPDTSGTTVQRYGRWKTDSFTVDKKIAQKLAASIAFLASEKQKGITWKKVPASAGTQSNLLLTYCLDDTSIPLANLMAFESDVEEFDDYQQAAENVLNLFKNSDLKPDSSVEIAEIIVLDKSNRKVNFSYSTNLQNIFDAATEWSLACKNSPKFKLLAQVNKEAKLLEPWPIEPMKFIGFSKIKFIRDGQESVPVPGMSFSETMRVFFSQKIDCKEVDQHWLLRLSDQFEPLLSLCSYAKTYYRVTDQQPRQRVASKSNNQALTATTLLSILLYKLNRSKEVYMNDFAYQLGQLCSALDELHIAYCHAERCGDIPTTTLGNTIYGMALQRPNKALDVLSSRIKPYLAWVKRSKDSEPNNKLIKSGLYASYWLSGVSEQLKQHINNDGFKVSDTYKAELMLGYLAGRPFEGNKKDSNQNATSTEGTEK